ncbi:NUDIX domain-containing protein [archaeon]|nr:MAG: NUDIX domain-containing protein [archaeon]
MLLCLFHLDIGLLFTINVKKKKIVIDVPGGKRNLAETSWECAMREAWEEIGIRLHDNVLIPDTRTTVASSQQTECQQDWKMSHHYVSRSMSVFLLYGKAMLQHIEQM